MRELAERGGYPVFIFPYDIFGRGITVPRERMMINGGGEWKFPVHECYVFPTKVNGVQDDRVIIRHLPHTTKTGSNPRNLRILESIPKEEMTAGLYYHLHGELSGAGRIPESVEAAKAALSHPDIGRPEKYELFLNLARLATNPEMKESFLVQAYGANPGRREALGLLACNCMDYGRSIDALVYARQMLATNKPSDEAWNDRPAAYGWLGTDIYCQALRSNGEYQAAEKVRRGALDEAGGPTIALIHATRGRPVQASACRKTWLDLAENPERIEHIFCIDEDDAESFPLRRMHSITVPAGGGCVAAWNAGAAMTCAPIIVQLSDDWMPTPGWDRTIIDRIGDTTQESVLAISDGVRTDRLLCMAICTRAYWAKDFFLFHPDFTGVYSDNYFTDVAYGRGAVIDARDIEFRHMHPMAGTAAVDETYKRQNNSEAYEAGKETYERLSTCYGWESIPGWFNYIQFYSEIADTLRDGDTIVEVGSWFGRSIAFLATRLKRQGKKVRIVVVDTFKGEVGQKEHEATVAEHGGSIRAAFDLHMIDCGVSGMIEVIESDSAEAASLFDDASLAFVYIDAAHDFKSVKRDVSAWKSKIVKGGILAGHDAQHQEVRDAVAEVLPDAKNNGIVWLKIIENN